MKLSDKRIRRTRQRLVDALVKLTLQKGYQAITIRDLADEAEVGYATFFRHYRAKDDLLGDALEVMLDELLGLLEHPKATDHEEVGALVFRHAQEHSELYRVLLDSQTVLERVYDVGIRGVLDTFTPRQDAHVPAEVAAHHVIASFLIMIRWWLDHDMPYPPERMGKIYRDLIIQPALRVTFKDS